MRRKNKKQLSRGVLIAFEGIDGSGKTTQAKILYEKLVSNAYPVVLFHEPTCGKWGKKIAELAKYGRDYIDAKTEFEYFYFDRMEDVHKNILPSLGQHKIVIMDRYYLSSVAYQGARGLDPKFIEQKNEEFAPKPDVVVILDLDSKTTMKRIKNRCSKPDFFEKIDYLKKVRQLFLTFSDRSYVKIIKVKDLDSVNYTASIIWDIIRDSIKIEQ